ncbi:MAG: DUF4157 domain-containing protein [Acidobacteriota bacterium]|nr:DUF4157 domain-containing protein [Acidobacteriota bacterium]
MLASLIANKASADPQRSTTAVKRRASAAPEGAQHLKVGASAPSRRVAAAEDGSGNPRRRLEEIAVLSAGEGEFEARPPIHAPGVAFQAKLRVGETDDPLEHEANRVAAEMMRAPSSQIFIGQAPPQISRKAVLSSRAGPESSLSTAQNSGGAAPGIVHQVLRGPGQPMDAELRAFMEPRFRQDFGQIRIHTDTTAAQSAKELNARAYTAGKSIVFAEGEFAPRSAGGRSLLAHELVHALQQGGQPQLIQRAPANYGSSAQVGAQQGPAATKAKPQLTVDDAMGFLVTFRYSSPEQFLDFLVKDEGQLYPFLKRFGFKGSWVKSEDYLKDFDAAAAKWGKADVYRRKAARAPRAAPPPKPKSREETKFEDAQRVLWQLENHPRERFQVNDLLESEGLMDDLVGLHYVFDGKERTFEKEGRWSHVAGPFYSQWASAALRVYIQNYRDARNIPAPMPQGKITSGEEIDIANARGEALETMEGSFLGSISGGIAMHFTNDPRVIAAAAGFGAAIEGTVGAVAYAVEGKGSYQPDVENKPAEAYTNNRDRISDPVDPAKVGQAPAREKLPTPDPHPDSAKAADEQVPYKASTKAPGGTSAGAAPSVEPQVTTTPESYRAVDPANKQLVAVGYFREGELELHIRAQTDAGVRGAIRGAEQFKKIVDYFGLAKIRSIKGSWSFGDNLSAFNEAIADKATPEAAAAGTWTGKQAKDVGFTAVHVTRTYGEPGKYTKVEVSFTRP